jgi:hypothetical protein
MNNNKQELSDIAYNRLFQQDRDGVAVLEDLASKYYDRMSYVTGDPHATSFNEGARSVILYIMQRAGSNE